MELYLKRIVVGDIGTNCYVAGKADTDGCVIIDPGADADKIASVILADGRKPEAILLTHGHFDHIGGVKELKERMDIPVVACIDEKNTLIDPDINLSAAFGRAFASDADVWVKDKDVIEYAGLTFVVYQTPGHTIGSVCYYVESEGLLFSGDTLFEGSVGRTDFPTGSSRMLADSIKKKLFLLPDKVDVYTGHGGSTNIGEEKRSNMYI